MVVRNKSDSRIMSFIHRIFLGRTGYDSTKNERKYVIIKKIEIPILGRLKTVRLIKIKTIPNDGVRLFIAKFLPITKAMQLNANRNMIV